MHKSGLVELEAVLAVARHRGFRPRGYDAGLRPSELVPRDMIRVPIGHDMCMAVVATPEYFTRHPLPKSPSDLARHQCIRARLPHRLDSRAGNSTGRRSNTVTANACAVCLVIRAHDREPPSVLRRLRMAAARVLHLIGQCASVLTQA